MDKKILEIGDLVAIQKWDGKFHIAGKVKRVTAKQAEIEGDFEQFKIQRTAPYKRISDFRRYQFVTPELELQIKNEQRKANLIHEIQQYNYDKLSELHVDTLNAVLSLLKGETK